jgi:ubiquinone/menaquinone biosynthesis C-methylase UbiE
MPTESKDKLKSSYVNAGSEKEVKRLELQANLFDELISKELDILSLQPGMRVLDAGCGTGAVTRRAALRTFPTEAVGIDIDSLFIEKAKKLSIVQGTKNARFETGNLLDLDFASGTFDLSYCRLVLTHVGNPKKALIEMQRVTKKGGTIAASEYDDGAILYYPKMLQMEKIWHKFGTSEKKQGRDRYFGRKLFSLFSEVGLHDVTIHPLTIHATQQNPEALKIFMRTNLSAFINSDNYGDLTVEVNSFLTDPGAFLMGVTFLAKGTVS